MDIAIRVVSVGRIGQDRAAVFSVTTGHVFALADGAGGTSGGAAAADAVIAAVRSSSPTSPSDCVRLLETLDRALVDVGQTTAVLATVTEGHVFGASVGDSAAWLIHDTGPVDLTKSQARKPLLGSGLARPVAFGPIEILGRLLLGSDGLFNYVRPDQIQQIASSASVTNVPDELVAAARLPSGGFQDDIAIIVAA